MTQIEFIMTCKLMGMSLVDQKDDGEVFVPLDHVTILVYQKHPRSTGHVTVLYLHQETYLVQNVDQLRKILKIFRDSMEDKTDRYTRLHKYAAAKLVATDDVR